MGHQGAKQQLETHRGWAGVLQGLGPVLARHLVLKPPIPGGPGT